MNVETKQLKEEVLKKSSTFSQVSTIIIFYFSIGGHHVPSPLHRFPAAVRHGRALL
jgi:hypothetical protein